MQIVNLHAQYICCNTTSVKYLTATVTIIEHMCFSQHILDGVAVHGGKAAIPERGLCKCYHSALAWMAMLFPQGPCNL